MKKLIVIVLLVCGVRAEEARILFENTAPFWAAVYTAESVPLIHYVEPGGRADLVFEDLDGYSYFCWGTTATNCDDCSTLIEWTDGGGMEALVSTTLAFGAYPTTPGAVEGFVVRREKPVGYFHYGWQTGVGFFGVMLALRIARGIHSDHLVDA
jgi:hypothetical protein